MGGSSKTNHMKHYVLFLTVFVLVHSSMALAWGKRGHQIVGETAAQLVSGEPNAEFMRDHSFDFAYYANVPDFIWKRPKTYDRERPEHYMDLEIFARAFRGRKDMMNPFALSRKDFEKRFPAINDKAGRAYWRIRELNDSLSKVTEELKDPELKTQKDRQKLQSEWLVLAGVTAHYVGDLAQPMHVTENYDGQMTNQKGLHHFYEEKLVDQLYPGLATKVMVSAQSQWKKFKKQAEKKTILDLLENLTKSSATDLNEVLKIDRLVGRKGELQSIARRHAKLIERELTLGSLTLAEIYRRQVGWPYDGEKFYFFAGEPEFIPPGVR